MSRVLVVEDDVLLAQQFQQQLEQAGFTVQLTHHVGAALDLLNKMNPSVIVLDLVLPVHSGFALLHELQSYDDTSQIPVVACVTSGDDLELEELRPYGVKRLLDKSTMLPADIVTAVRAVS